MAETVKGFDVNIYKAGAIGESSNGGISSIYNSCTLTSEDIPNLPKLFEVRKSSPEVVLIKRTRIGDIIAVPKSILDSGRHYMFGGSFIYTSDSRFSERVSNQPIKLFDRVED